MLAYGWQKRIPNLSLIIKCHNGFEPSPSAWKADTLPLRQWHIYEIVAFDLYSFSLFNNPYEGKNLLKFRGAWDIFQVFRETHWGSCKAICKNPSLLSEIRYRSFLRTFGKNSLKKYFSFLIVLLYQKFFKTSNKFCPFLKKFFNPSIMN